MLKYIFTSFVFASVAKQSRRIVSWNGLLRLWLAMTNVIILTGCNEKLEMRLPPKGVMHFPFNMALNDNVLFISTSSLDGRYHKDRLMRLDTKESILIDEDPSPMQFYKDKVIWACKSTNKIVSVSKDLKSPMKESFLLNANNPYGLSLLNDYLLVSYLSSDQLDIINIADDKFKLLKTYKLLPYVQSKLTKPMSKKYGVVTRQIYSNKKNTYLALEKRKKVVPGEHNGVSSIFHDTSKAAFLVRLPNQDLIDNKDPKIEFYNLKDLFSLRGILDIHIDDKEEFAYILGTNPNALYKFHLKDKIITDVAGLYDYPSYMALGLEKTILIPSLSDGILAEYSMDNLSLVKVSKKLGRGASIAVVDTDKKLIYVSLYKDGTVVRLNDKLEDPIYLFDKAPANRIGS